MPAESLVAGEVTLVEASAASVAGELAGSGSATLSPALKGTTADDSFTQKVSRCRTNVALQEQHGWAWSFNGRIERKTRSSSMMCNRR